MKTRNGFVSNSSSSSFVVRKDALTEEQIQGIYDHNKSEQFKDVDYLDDKDVWTILDQGETLLGYTWMDNFDMRFHLQELGIKEEDVEFDRGLPDIAWERDANFGD